MDISDTRHLGTDLFDLHLLGPTEGFAQSKEIAELPLDLQDFLWAYSRMFPTSRELMGKLNGSDLNSNLL